MSNQNNMMKSVLSTLLICTGLTAINAQEKTYFFNGSLADASGASPALNQTLACGAAPGLFADSMIQIPGGTCGIMPQPIFHFNTGGGLLFPNGMISGTYTIHILFSFNQVNGYRRIIDFKNGQSDYGIYAHNGLLNFYPSGDIGSVNVFSPNTYNLISLVRDSATQLINVYVNGNAFVNYTDASAYYQTTGSSSPVIFFRDDTSSNAQCENSEGNIKYLNIRATTSTAAEVAATYANICQIALPLRLLSFSVKQLNGTRILNWQTARESDTRDFIVERSFDSKSWTELATIMASGTEEGNYLYTDLNHYTNAKVFYRLKMRDIDLSGTYSPIVITDGDETQSVAPALLINNPATNVINVELSGFQPEAGAQLSLWDINAKCVRNIPAFSSPTADIPVHDLPNGLYILRYRDARHSLQTKVVVQR